MPNYQNGKIYKLECIDTGLIYVGSTVQTLSQRLAEHRHRFRNNILTCNSGIVMENNNYKLSLIEKFPCANKKELFEREQFYINQTDCVNKHRAIVTEEQRLETLKRCKKEWCARNVEYLKEYRREWRRKRREEREEENA